jgi:hypothetical protein
MPGEVYEKCRPQHRQVECMCTKPPSTFRLAEGFSSLTDLIVRNKNALIVTELILDNPSPPPPKKYRDGKFHERRFVGRHG